MRDVPASPTRLVSLDAFRGLTIAGMVLVNNPGSWSHIYRPLRHADWHGWTPTDLIFPFFLFVVGVAIPFSFRRRLETGAQTSSLMRHVLRRSLILIALGVAMRAIPSFDWAEMRLYGVLQRIGLVYLLAGAAYLYLDARGRVVTGVALLLSYWVVMTFVPVPGFGAGDLSADGNLAAWLDRLLMSGRLWQGTWDPEGLLSTFPALVTSLLGIVTGDWLQGDQSGEMKTLGMLSGGVFLAVLGLIWGLVFPINKNLWTSSFTVFTGGTALLLFGSMYWLIDVKRVRGMWNAWMVVYGMNAITVYVASGMVSKMLGHIRIGGEDGPSLYSWVYEMVFRSWAGDVNGSLAFALAYLAIWLGLMWVLHAKRVYVKI